MANFRSWGTGSPPIPPLASSLGAYDPVEQIHIYDFIYNDLSYGEWGCGIFSPPIGALQKIIEKH